MQTWALAIFRGISQDESVERTVYQILGEEGFDRLTQAFYARVPDDDVLGPMYPADQIEAARIRLRDFLIGRFGGPQRYVEQRGHPRLRMRHMPFPIDVQARNRWMRLMSEAVVDARIPAAVAEPLLRFFAQTATFMINRASR